MKSIFLLIASLCATQVFAQSKIAVYTPSSNTTHIWANFDSAYSNSVAGDYIYLPGGSFTLTNTINKQIHIIGAGYNQDSSSATGITALNQVQLSSGADGGSIEGVYFTPSSSNLSSSISVTNSGTPISHFTIAYCYLSNGLKCIAPAENFTITKCYIGSINDYYTGLPVTSLSGPLTNSVISNSIITSSVQIEAGGLFSNNIFFGVTHYYSGDMSPAGSSNCTYENNIFQFPAGNNELNNGVFNNNINASPNANYGNVGSGNTSEGFSDSFVDPGQPNGNGWYNYDVHKSYKLKPTSAGYHAGTDGTDIGIYGGAMPWKDGSMPSNPHISSKTVGTQNDASGILHATFKVKPQAY